MMSKKTFTLGFWMETLGGVFTLLNDFGVRNYDLVIFV